MTAAASSLPHPHLLAVSHPYRFSSSNLEFRQTVIAPRVRTISESRSFHRHAPPPPSGWWGLLSPWSRCSRDVPPTFCFSCRTGAGGGGDPIPATEDVSGGTWSETSDVVTRSRERLPPPPLPSHVLPPPRPLHCLVPHLPSFSASLSVSRPSHFISSLPDPAALLLWRWVACVCLRVCVCACVCARVRV